MVTRTHKSSGIVSDERSKRVHSSEQPSPVMTTPHAIVQMQRVIGNRAVTQMLQRKVQTRTINHTATSRDGVTSLKAVIGADDLWGRGSKAQAGQPSRIKTVGTLKGRYVGGHMLNQEVGGNGTWDNMIVQSHTSNTNMNLHDNVLKRLGSTARRLEDMGNTSEKKYEYYAIEDITVHPANPNGNENFPGERFVPESLSVTITPEKRHKGTKKVTAWTGHGETINNPYDVDNVPPYPRKPGVTPLKVNLKSFRMRNMKKLRGKSARILTKKQLGFVTGIGPKKAVALRRYFKANPVTLANLILAAPRGQGFTLTDLNNLAYAQLK